MDAGEVALFGRGSETGTDGIEIDINHASGDGGEIEQTEASEAGFKEATLDVILFVCSACDEFVETTHEPAQAGQSFAQHGDTIRAIGQGGDLLLTRGFNDILFAVVVREEGQPAGSDFAIGPGGDDVGAGAQDGVIVIIHDGVGADFDGEDSGELVQPVDEPRFTVGEVALRDGVETGEKSAADTPAEAVVDPFFTIFDVSAAWESHGSPRFTITNGEHMD